ncbi:MAG TPA: methylenetetrahydrofolate reductase [NAD(P)H], partial [Gammaproteobacteria bacterium]|nr:methylenetetrahydrofolate reductase [NAD(P)H] [Gammaproteobacteria bacterium]
WRSIERLAPLQPSFVSVTYGAGGGTRERTHQTVARILNNTQLTPAAHLTCVGASREEINTIIARYKKIGVRHIVALRGDPPVRGHAYKPYPGGYAYAADLVAGIGKLGDFDITVAAYPEGHPESTSEQADLENLLRKIDAGANRAISQFFFDPDVFLRFRDRVRAAGITVPIIPGILPVTNFKRVHAFAKTSGASVPRWLAKKFEGLDEQPHIRQLVATSVVADQCRILQSEGVDEFHFYTLNRDELTRAICQILGVRPLGVTQQ